MRGLMHTRVYVCICVHMHMSRDGNLSALSVALSEGTVQREAGEGTRTIKTENYRTTPCLHRKKI
jgi:hypothetical protein